jgi:hypothetical protein
MVVVTVSTMVVMVSMVTEEEGKVSTLKGSNFADWKLESLKALSGAQLLSLFFRTLT